MRDKIIHKAIAENKIHPNLVDYDADYASFSWDQAFKKLDGLPQGQGLNIAYEAVDRHMLQGRAHKIALRFIDKHNNRKDFTYQQLQIISNQFANVLRALDVGPGDSVYVLSERIPELYISALGAWKTRNVFCPLFSAFGSEPIKLRLGLGAGKVLVTTAALYHKKVKQIRNSLPALKHILIIDENTIENTLNFYELLTAAATEYTIPATHPEEVAILHFTSGTTGIPKGAMHAHQAVVAHHVTGQIALDFHAEDIFWCTADPGWVTGTSYGIISPLTNGLSSIIDEAEFDAERWYGILQQERVSVWYTAPTAIRMMMKMGMDLVRKHTLPALRFIASVGEPLNAQAVWWGMEAFNLPIHDNWWQTETGGIMIANYQSQDIKPGSMGRPLPGIEACIVERKGEVIEVIHEPGITGELALKKNWPSLFRGYLHEEVRYQQCFVNDFYLTGDLASIDEEGYFWFVGRKDDVIKSSGHLIGPFEVESILLEHPAVAEAGVIGKPDPLALEIVKAFVALKPGFTESEALALDIIGYARKQLGAAVAPKEIDFLASIPKTKSGKIMRRLLKAQELGLPLGDTSTLDTSL